MTIVEPASLFVFPEWVSQEALRLLKNNLEVAKVFNPDVEYELHPEFPIGSTVKIKYPQRFVRPVGGAVTLPYSEPLTRIPEC